MNINISEIANRLGLSKTTVSFVINGKGDKYNISKETRKRVMKLIHELNYVPNFNARNLKRGNTQTISYITPDISNPFFAKLGRKIESLMSEYGYHLIFSSTDENPVKEGQLINSFLSRQIDGVILASSDLKSSAIQNLLDRKIPVVFFDREDESINGNFITIENKLSMKRAVEILISEGCKKTGLLSLTPDVYSLRNRIEGYKLALCENNLEIDSQHIRIVDYNNLRESTHNELSALMELGTDSIVFTNNLLATESIWVINKNYPHKLHDLKLVSFDNIDMFDYSFPRVLSLAQPIDEMAEQIVKLLLSNIKNEEAPQKRIVLDPIIIKRK